MASAMQTATKLLESIASSGLSTSTEALLDRTGIDGKGPYARKILNALATENLIGKFRRKGEVRWRRVSEEVPSSVIIRNALRNLSTAKPKKPKMPATPTATPPALPAPKAEEAPRVKKMVSDYFEMARDLAKCRRPIMLVGPAGCGKTYLASKVAEQLEMGFAAISCSAGMSETHLLGRSIPNVTDGTSRFQTTDFLNCYENGGVFLLDEIDAADPNLLVMLNSGLANGYLSVPSRSENPSAKMHKDFVIFASANTFGRGADRLYVGRAQLDEATIDRFRMGTIQMDYDKKVETSLCASEDLLDVCWQIRSKIESNKLRRLMSTRFIRDAFEMFDKMDWSIQQIVNIFFQGWSADEQARCMPIIPTKKKIEVLPPEGEVRPGGSSTDEWAMPPLSMNNRAMLNDAGIKIRGLSAKQVEYAERIVNKWMNDAPSARPVIHELKPICHKTGNDFAGRIIRWYKMKYVPGRGGDAPEE